jgi:hypothetical protein
MGKDRYALGGPEASASNIMFLRNYGYQYWYSKLCSIDFILENSEKISQPIDEVPTGLNTESDEADGKWGIEHYAKAEYVFSCYHLTEALFASIYAFDKRNVFWIDIRELYTSQLEDYIENRFIENTISYEDMINIFYPLVDMFETELVDDTRDSSEILEDSLDFLQQYLEELARLFMDRDIYNHYKHGMRIAPGDVSFDIGDLSDVPEEYIDEDTGRFKSEVLVNMKREKLEEHTEQMDDGHDYYSLCLKISSIDYEEWRKIYIENYLILKQMFQTMNLILDSEPYNELAVNDELDNYDIVGFEDDGIDKYFNFDTGFEILSPDSVPRDKSRYIFESV